MKNKGEIKNAQLKIDFPKTPFATTNYPISGNNSTGVIKLYGNNDCVTNKSKSEYINLVIKSTKSF